MAELTITIRSHHFMVTRITPRGRAAVDAFARRYAQYGFMRNTRNPYTQAVLKVYAAATADRHEFRFHINTLKDFELVLESQYIKGDMIAYETTPLPVGAKATFTFKPGWSDREHQPPVIDYLIFEGHPLAKFVDLQTGQGKSYCSVRAMQHRGLRTLVIVKPMYLDKWQEDLERMLDLVPEDILIVKGANQLIALLMLAEAGKIDAKIIMISNKTMQNWIKLYEKIKSETLALGYACMPDQLCEILNVGIRLIDEVHQDFHLNYKIDLYTNVANSISLSATLLSDDDFVNQMYEIAYPAASRYKGPAYKRYVSATAVIYRFKNPSKIRYKDPVSKNYSHHVFEQSILRSDMMTDNYLGLIKRVIAGSYLVDYRSGDKLIIYCSSIDMCTLVSSYLKKQYTNLDVRRYVEDDPFETLNIADIIVSTLGSAGTAVDIPNLTTVILTTAIASSQGNIQGLGRLRELNYTTPEFLYFVCEDITKHLDYHERKRVILERRAKTYRSRTISMPL